MTTVVGSLTTWIGDDQLTGTSKIFILSAVMILYFVKTACLGKSGSQVMTKNAIGLRGFMVFLTCQYFINELISDFDFLNVDIN